MVKRKRERRGENEIYNLPTQYSVACSALAFGDDNACLCISRARVHRYDATAHTTKMDLPFDWSSGVHSYSVAWSPTAIIYSVDDVEMHRESGEAGVTIPFAAGASLVILRPKDDVYISDSAFVVEAMTYEPLAP